MIAVVDSGVANLTSVMAALRRLGAEVTVTTSAQTIVQASHVILPGVGAAAAAMARLRQKGLVDVLRGLTQPVLGICLGMQLLFEKSEEGGDTPCLGILPGTAALLSTAPCMPVPHMGWNQLQFQKADHPLLLNVEDGPCVYFVHSYALPVTALTVASTCYTSEFTSIAAGRNFAGCQFHPERSGEVGSRLLGNFLGM